MGDVFAVNEVLFKSSDKLLICKYDSAQIGSDSNSMQCQIRLNSVNIYWMRTIRKWKRDDNTGGCIQIYCAKTLTIGKTGRIDANKCGYSKGFGFGQATKK